MPARRQGLRGEPVLLGLIVGLAVTFGLNFSSFNVSLAAGADSNADGWCASPPAALVSPPSSGSWNSNRIEEKNGTFRIGVPQSG